MILSISQMSAYYHYLQEIENAYSRNLLTLTIGGKNAIKSERALPLTKIYNFLFSININKPVKIIPRVLLLVADD